MKPTTKPQRTPLRERGLSPDDNLFDYVAEINGEMEASLKAGSMTREERAFLDKQILRSSRYGHLTIGEILEKADQLTDENTRLRTAIDAAYNAETHEGCLNVLYGAINGI